MRDYVLCHKVLPSIASCLFDQIHLLTPWSRVLLEKLTGSQLVKKFPEFYGIRKFITVFTSVATCPETSGGTEPDQSGPFTPTSTS
jgi:hypothetical protein